MGPLCAGTLTLNKLTTEKGSVLCMGGRSLDEVLKLSALSANIVSEEPIDMVLHHSYDAHATLWDAHVSVRPLWGERVGRRRAGGRERGREGVKGGREEWGEEHRIGGRFPDDGITSHVTCPCSFLHPAEWYYITGTCPCCSLHAGHLSVSDEGFWCHVFAFSNKQ